MKRAQRDRWLTAAVRKTARRASPGCVIARQILDGDGLRLSVERNPEILDAYSCPFPRVGFAGGARYENPAPPVQQTQ
jgi:hypothetical protein